MSKWQAVADLARAQEGVVARTQLEEVGLSPRTVSYMAREHAWERAHPGVFRLPGTPETLRQRVIAAQLALAIPSVATAMTAAALYGLRPPPKVVELLVDEHARVRPPAGTHLTRTRTLVPSDITTLGIVRCATGTRMVVDLAGRAQPGELRALMIDARQRRLLDLARLQRRVAEIGPVRGRGVVKQLAWELDVVRCDSILEERVRRLLASSGLPSPHPSPVAARAGGRTVHIDIGWPACQVGIEVDGLAYHAGRAAMDVDHRRGNALLLAGWRILRVGWSRVDEDPGGFCAEVRALLAGKLEDQGNMLPTSSKSEGGAGLR